jgi:predicted phosphoribosyltransferase
MMEGANHVVFNNRIDAGTLLASKFNSSGESQSLVLGLARGGVAVARSFASALRLSLDVLVIKKLSSPYNSEFALGAVAPDTVSVVHWSAAHRVGVDEQMLAAEIQKKSGEIRLQLSQYRKGMKPLNVRDRQVILIDDGAATGATMEAAIRWVRSKRARRVIVGVPVASVEAMKLLTPEADRCVIYEVEHDLTAVGEFYKEFPQVSDADVVELLRHNRTPVTD